MALAVLTNLPNELTKEYMKKNGPIAVGIQLESPTREEILSTLDKAIQAHPDADLLVLSEYTFHGSVPKNIRSWCQKQDRYLIAGGAEPTPEEGDFYNTAFVIGPDGEVVFKQAKSVPIQFFLDGRPAPHQRLWDSPWGKIGICICYDLCYGRVVDELVRQGAQAIVAPAMDLAQWGVHEHELNVRFAALRGAEHNIPVFRLGSSGISQLILPGGQVLDSAPFPGQGQRVAGQLPLVKAGTIPLDRPIAMLSVYLTVVIIGWLLFTPVYRAVVKTRSGSDVKSS